MRRIHQAIAVAVATVALAAAGCTSQTGTGAPPAASSGGAKGTLTLGTTLTARPPPTSRTPSR